jgi:tripartite-type tricarboxylate transporter receptor subunit TctC
MQISINNNTVSMQVAEILPLLLRMYDPETLAKYDNLTPTTLDQLSDYADAVAKLRFTLGAGAAAGMLSKQCCQTPLRRVPVITLMVEPSNNIYPSLIIL